MLHGGEKTECEDIKVIVKSKDSNAFLYINVLLA